MTKKPLFYPLRYIRSEYGTAYGICTKGYKDPLDAMRESLKNCRLDQGDMNDYTIATQEDGKFLPIPMGTDKQLKKEV